MSTECLTIKNFGPIKKAKLRIRKYNIFIGDTACGKSIAAKLISIFNSEEFLLLKTGDYENFIALLSKYNIDFPFHQDTLISYKYWNISYRSFITDNNRYELVKAIQNNDQEVITKILGKNFIQPDTHKKDLFKKILDLLEHMKDDKQIQSFAFQYIKDILFDEFDINNPIYIPAERILISMFSNNIFSLLEANINIPECIKRFGSQYEKAKNSKIQNQEIDFMNIKVSFEKSDDVIVHEVNKETVKLTQASSGIQSIIPLWVVIENNFNSIRNNILIVEEPELNLYPTMQVKLMESILSKIENSLGTLVVTTHSPYILSVFDNLILANEILKKSRYDKAVKENIKQITKTDLTIHFNDVSSYLFKNDGNVVNIRDNDLKTVGAEQIDQASNYLSDIFEDLCNIDTYE